MVRGGGLLPGSHTTCLHLVCLSTGFQLPPIIRIFLSAAVWPQRTGVIIGGLDFPSSCQTETLPPYHQVYQLLIIKHHPQAPPPPSPWCAGTTARGVTELACYCLRGYVAAEGGESDFCVAAAPSPPTESRRTTIRHQAQQAQGGGR